MINTTIIPDKEKDINTEKLDSSQFDKIPDEMKAVDQWVVWKATPKKDKPGEFSKVPYKLDGSYPQGFNIHQTFKQVQAAFETGRVDGIGFAVTPKDDYICFDLDGDSLEDIPEGLRSIANLSYAEKSPSGNGLHVWFKGKKPEGAGAKENRYTNGEDYKVECFFETGYLTFTGDAVNDLDVEENQSLIDYIYSSTKLSKDKKEAAAAAPNTSKPIPKPVTALSDEEVLKRAFKKSITKSLYETGDISKYNNDHSLADHALCKDLAKISSDADQIERLFRQSALFRDEPVKHKTYPARTVASAMLKVASELEELTTTQNAPQVVEVISPFFDGKTFIPKWLGDAIIEKYPLFFEGNHLYIYHNGVYRRDEGGVIGRIVVEMLQKEYRKSRLSEVVSYLQNKTWTPVGKINADDHLINLENGLLDWKSNRFYEHTPDHISTIQLPIKYNPAAKCTNIDQFIRDVVPADTIPVIYEWFGYSMIPNTRYEKAIILTGTGANGKSKLIELYERFIGDLNISNVPLQDLEQNRFKLAQLYGKLANVFADIPASALEKTSIFKTVTSGDGVSAEFKGSDSFNFKPFSRLTFSANELPRTSDTSDGFFRRLIVIEFPNKFGVGGKPRDPNIMDKLITDEELSGLLNKALQGLGRLETNGTFTENESTDKAIEQYKKDANPVAQFVEDSIKLDPKKHEEKQDVYNEYVFWCGNNNAKALGKNKFFNRLENVIPLETFRPSSGGKRCYRGVILNRDWF